MTENYRTIDFAIKCVGSGALIGIAGIAYLEIGGLVGAAVFGLALYLIIINKLTLYTGAIGYALRRKTLGKTFWALPFNLLGACCVGYVYSWAYDPSHCVELLSNKLELPYLTIFLRGALCGAMMVCAVESSKQGSIGIFISVFIFVACKFEHCIADTFYIFCCPEPSLKSVPFFIVVLCGNTVGSLVMRELIAKKE